MTNMKEKFDTSKYIMIPYKNKGRTSEGCDCWGLVRLVYMKEFDIILPTLLAAYSNAMDGEKVSTVVEANKPLVATKQKDAPEYGDVVIFNMRGNPCHVGVYVGRNKVLHILSGTNSTLESMDSFRLKGRVEGYYEIS
jgi:cell wall-associated NlpC family hydrolase